MTDTAAPRADVEALRPLAERMLELPGAHPMVLELGALAGGVLDLLDELRALRARLQRAELGLEQCLRSPLKQMGTWMKEYDRANAAEARATAAEAALEAFGRTRGEALPGTAWPVGDAD